MHVFTCTYFALDFKVSENQVPQSLGQCSFNLLTHTLLVSGCMAMRTLCLVEADDVSFYVYRYILHFFVRSSGSTLEFLTLLITLEASCLIPSIFPRYGVEILIGPMRLFKISYHQMWYRYFPTHYQLAHI